MMARSFRIGALCVLLVCLFESSAGAQPATASEHLEAGVEAYQQGDFERALRHYQAAYALEPRVELLYAMAQSERALGNCAGAVALYRRFLQQTTSEQQRAAAEANIERCEEAPPVPAPAPQPEPNAATPEPARPRDPGVTPEPATRPPPEAASPHGSRPEPKQASPVSRAGEDDRTPWYLDPWGGALVVVGSAATIVGGTVWSQAQSDHRAALQRAEQPAEGTYSGHLQDIDDVNDQRRTATILFIGGGVLIGGAIARYWWVGSDHPVTLRASEEGAMLRYQGAF